MDLVFYNIEVNCKISPLLFRCPGVKSFHLSKEESDVASSMLNIHRRLIGEESLQRRYIHASAVRYGIGVQRKYARFLSEGNSSATNFIHQVA